MINITLVQVIIYFRTFWFCHDQINLIPPPSSGTSGSLDILFSRWGPFFTVGGLKTGCHGYKMSISSAIPNTSG